MVSFGMVGNLGITKSSEKLGSPLGYGGQHYHEGFWMAQIYGNFWNM